MLWRAGKCGSCNPASRASTLTRISWNSFIRSLKPMIPRDASAQVIPYPRLLSSAHGTTQGLFSDFLDLVGALEGRLTQEDESFEGFRLQMLNLQDDLPPEGSGMTVFHHVVAVDLPDHAAILLDAGADATSIRTDDGLTAAGVGQRPRNPPIAQPRCRSASGVWTPRKQRHYSVSRASCGVRTRRGFATKSRGLIAASSRHEPGRRAA